METMLMELANSQGIWAALFIFLFLYQLKENKTAREESRVREDKLVTFINEMSRSFEKLTSQYERLTEDVEYIKMEVAKNSKEDKQ